MDGTTRMSFDDALLSVLRELYGDKVKLPIADTATLTYKTVKRALERMNAA